MVPAMARKIWEGVGRFADALSIAQTVWSWTVISSILGLIMTWAASAIDPIRALGWGAAVFAGVSMTCALLFLMSTSLIAWRYFNPLPPSALASPQYKDRLLSNADAIVVDGEPAAPMMSVDSSVLESVMRRIQTLEDRFQALVDTSTIQAGNQAQFQQRVTRALAARDDLVILQEGAEKIRSAFTKLQDVALYADKHQWNSDYGFWEGEVKNYYYLLRQWSEGLVYPLSVGPERLASVKNVPGQALLAEFEMQQRYRTLIVVQPEFDKLHCNAVEYMKDRGRLA
jgi:hypothetical protein